MLTGLLSANCRANAGLLYKDGGLVMGIQLENEYTHGKEGESHIMWLKNAALKYGIDVYPCIRLRVGEMVQVPQRSDTTLGWLS